MYLLSDTDILQFLFILVKSFHSYYAYEINCIKKKSYPIRKPENRSIFTSVARSHCKIQGEENKSVYKDVISLEISNYTV